MTKQTVNTILEHEAVAFLIAYICAAATYDTLNPFHLNWGILAVMFGTASAVIWGAYYLFPEKKEEPEPEPAALYKPIFNDKVDRFIVYAVVIMISCICGAAFLLWALKTLMQ